MAGEASGIGGDVDAGPGSIAGIREWHLTWTGEALETTAFDDSGVRTYISGLTGWSGTFTGYDIAAAPAPAVGATVAVLTLDVTATKNYYGKAIITSAAVGVTVDGVNTIDYAFQGTGILTPPA